MRYLDVDITEGGEEFGAQVILEGDRLTLDGRTLSGADHPFVVVDGEALQRALDIVRDAFLRLNDEVIKLDFGEVQGS